MLLKSDKDDPRDGEKKPLIDDVLSKKNIGWPFEFNCQIIAMQYQRLFAHGISVDES
jgi:hypothetical protein